MPKLDLLDLETFINLPTSHTNSLKIPHQINSNTLLSRTTTTSPNTASQETVNLMRRNQAESSGVFYQPKTPKLKLEMEIFGDVGVFCQPTKVMAAKAFPNVADELNTPVFEKAPFDYDRPSHSTGLLDVVTSTEDPFNYKIKTELPSVDNVNNIDDNLMIKDCNIAFMEGESKNISNIMPSDINTSMGRTINNNNYVVISSQGISTNSSNVFTPNNSEYEDILYRNTSDKVTPLYKGLVNEEDEYLPTVNNCSDIYFNNNSNSYCFENNENSNSHVSDSPQHQYIILETAPFETPDNSLSASEFSDNGSLPLTLKIDQKLKSTGDVLDTPDVIETIDSIENEKGFNILSFITEEDINTAEPALSALDIPVLTLEVSNDASQLPIKKVSVSTSKCNLKRKHKRDEDDEDYVPPVPVKRKVVGRKTLKIQSKPVQYDSDSSVEDEEEEKVKLTRRGRPPKRNVSICSDEYSDGTGKYREMRDKNNEASRKSRLKRKLKEMAHEDEANGLEERNMKLRAQVVELERTVNSFRNNLMQILLNK